MKNTGRGGMAAKIGAAVGAVAPGSSCGACLITSGSDLNCIRSILSPEYTPEPGEVKGTLFATPGSELENLAFSEVDNDVRYCRYHNFLKPNCEIQSH